MIKTRKELKDCIGIEKSLYAKLTFKDFYCHNEEYLTWNYQLLARKVEFYANNKNRNVICKLIYLFYYRKFMIKCRILNTYLWTGAFQPGLRIWHLGGITISRDCKIGRFCTIRKNVLIGHSFNEKKSPIIEDYVNIGIGAQIVGKLKIGRGTVICNGAVVTYNTPPYSIVMGNPAKIIGFKMSPDEIIDFEKQHYPETERLSIDELNSNYEKFYLNRWKDIKVFLKK